MQTDIRSAGKISSSQKSIHPGLARMIDRHMSGPWLQPIHKATLDAWNRLKLESGFSADSRFILDSGCGTGASTQFLANLHPNLKVLGVDQSDSRLSKNGVHDGFLIDGNLILLRAELSSLWRLMLVGGYQPEYHYLLNPNPWPKPGHLKRRWHGHPVFPDMLALGGAVEMRCNWDIYASEFAYATSLLCGQEISVQPYVADTPMSLFEEKYKQRGHALYSVAIPAAVCAAYKHRRSVQEELSSSADSNAGAAGGGV